MPIYFCGDSTIDNYEFYGELDSTDDSISNGETTQRRGWEGPKKVIVRQFGGAYLLARFTSVAWSLWYGTNDRSKWQMKTLQPWSNFRDGPLKTQLDELFKQPRNFDHYLQISYRLRKCEDQYRIPRGEHGGLTPPQHTKQQTHVVGAKELPLDADRNDVCLYVVNDGAAAARYNQPLAEAIAAAEASWVVMKIVDPPAKAEDTPILAKLLKERPEKVIGVVPGDEFRKSGMPISRSLSWERTLRDTVEEVRSGRLLPDSTPTHLIITFDYDAALYLQTKAASTNAKERVVEAGSLVFSIHGSEGEFENKIDGDMPGAQTAFVSVLSTLLYARLNESAKNDKVEKNPLADIDKILACALIVKRRLLQSGFEIDKNGLPFKMDQIIVDGTERQVPRLFYSEGIFSLQAAPPPSNDDPSARPPDPSIGFEGLVERRDFYDPFAFADAFAKNLASQKLAIYNFQPHQIPTENWRDWSIFEKVAGHRSLSDYTEYVITEKTPTDVPICSFGRIKTADVREIEDFRTVGNLLQSYLSNLSESKPIGIAVFGPPGAGKSFAVKNIVDTLPENVRRLTKDDRHECNLTALSGLEDLAHYFQLARNSVVRGKVPMLFFDEFDCTVGDSPLFWLKHFLAPLQDGEFRSDQIVHPLGRVIFVFAGGVYGTFEDFAKAMKTNSDIVKASVGITEDNEDVKEPARKEAKIGNQTNFKGIDFLSRLHGHINIAPFTPKPNANAFYRDEERKLDVLIEPSYLMKRAFILRSLLDRHLENIFSHGSPREARIDRKIVNALLATKTFSHGSRSMEAIIRMSVLEGRDRFEISHLPPNNQLKMHVDVDNFSDCLECDIDAIWERAAARRD
jgi:hypothetical protein